MRRPSHARSLSSSRDGVALVIVLAFIVLLSILVVSFVTFSRLNRGATASYSRSIQAEEIAQGGLQDILGDFRQEIIAGSTVTTSGTNTVYTPLANAAAMPARLGYNTNYYGIDITSTNLPPTLIRVSRASQDGTPSDFYPPLSTTIYTGTQPVNYASAANSSSNSVNGRYVSASRWNKISLLTTNNTSASYIAPQFATNTPDWVYYTRAGRAVCTAAGLAQTKPSNNLTNASPVIGRYAYAVYDEGALLDINVAGYVSAAGNAAGYATNVAIPTVPATNNPAFIKQTLSAKSYLAYADLTQLPGLSGAQTSVIDPLIKWRNASVDLTTSTTAATNYFQMVFNGAKNGFTSFQTSGNGTDSPILGRQDLINYFAKIDSSGTTYSQALPYLGTFSRALNAPSWHPTLNATAMPGYYGTSTFGNTAGYFNEVAYKDVAENTASANRDLPNVRYGSGTPSGTSIKHYDDLGNATTYHVSPGDPVVRSRFSLAKLAWLTWKGPSADLATSDPLYNAGGTDANIQACFGLIWETQTSAWGTLNQTYGDHPDRWRYIAATTTNVHILTLDEVANGCTGVAAGYTGYREPNFFELLRAGILSGSLGQSPGAVTTGYLVTDSVLGAGFDVTNVDKTRHILQIGANIIDQSDSDSIPTAIYLQEFPTLTLEADLVSNTVFGDENLPGITRIGHPMVQDPYYMSGTPSALFNCFKAWQWPELWNIHQAPGVNVNLTSTGTPGYPYPSQIRMHVYGKSYFTDKYTKATLSGSPPAKTDYNGTSNAIDYDDNTTAYTYYDNTGTKVTSGPTGAQLSLLYINEGTATGTASSTFYNSPSFLQWATGGTPTMFGWTTAPTSNSATYTAGQTMAINLFFSPNYGRMPEDSTNPNPTGDIVLTASGQPDGANTVQFAGVFGGEDPNVPDLSQAPVSGTADVQIFQYETNPMTYSLECQDSNVPAHWHPYNFLSRVSAPAMAYGLQTYTTDTATPANRVNYFGTLGQSTAHAAIGSTYLLGALGRPDPRTDRFSVSNALANGNYLPMSASMDLHPSRVAFGYGPNLKWGFVNSPPVDPSGATYGNAIPEGAWSFNQTSLVNSPYNTPGPGFNYIYTNLHTSLSGYLNAFYVDPDGIIRPGDSYRAIPIIYTSSSSTTGDGRITYTGSLTTTPAGKLSGLLDGTGKVGSSQARRPVVLNRPFRSVGELGYVFRDLPYKSLDFFSPSSGDTALLDLFSITDEPAITAGQVNPSNMPASSLTAILAGSGKMAINDPAPQQYNFILASEASAFASGLASQIAARGPLTSRADLVSYLDPALSTLINSNLTGTPVSPSNYRNKAYAEAPVRALAGVTNSRTWNLLIDIIAQSGNMSPSASTLNDFVVQGERRYWLHIAIDRYTGKIIDQQLEPVYE